MINEKQTAVNAPIIQPFSFALPPDIKRFISGGKAKEKGWMIGALTAVCFSLIILLFQYLGFGKTFTSGQLLFHLGFLGVSMLGGIFGVNLKGSRSA